MKRETFSISIDAPKEKVWDILWDENTYTLWTSPFCEGSTVVTDWNIGSKVQFLAPGGSGIVSSIAEKRIAEFMSFRHLGEIREGIEDTSSDSVKEWAGSMENYTLIADGNKTVVTVDIDVSEKYEQYFQEVWPKALMRVKELVEKTTLAQPV